MPDAILPFAKAWAALIGSLLTVLVASIEDAPRWLLVVTALVTALAVYRIPNQEADGEEPGDGGPV